MSTASVTYTFSAGTDAVASEVNTNFSDLVTFINGQCIQKDGSLSMTQALTLSGAPTSSLHAATKAYVDSLGSLGTLGYAQVAADQLNLNSTPGEDLTGLSATVTVGTSRRVRITGRYMTRAAVDNQIFEMRIQESTTVLQTSSSGGSGLGGDETIHDAVVITPSSGEHTYKLVGASQSGTGDLEASSTNPAFILVEDIGAA